MADEQLDSEPRDETNTVREESATGVETVASDHDAVPPQYGIGPFSIREVVLLGIWVLAFVTSFFSLSLLRFDSVWTSGLGWILAIGVPTVAVFLLVLRRLSPTGIRRVGSLGIDQFASVAFSVSAVVWLAYIWETVAFVADGGPWVRSWVMWLEFVLMLAGVVLTVLAPYIPVIGDDFRHRPEIVAHRNARPLRPISPRPEPEPRPAPESEYAPAPAYDAPPAYDGAAAYDGGYGDAAYPPAASAPVTDEREWAAPTAVFETPAAEPEPVAEPAPARQQAFWALAPDERDVVDEEGSPIFRIGPTAWALVIEDRGDVFVVRHEDGRIGYLHDVSDVTRG